MIAPGMKPDEDGSPDAGRDVIGEFALLTERQRAWIMRKLPLPLP